MLPPTCLVRVNCNIHLPAGSGQWICPILKKSNVAPYVSLLLNAELQRLMETGISGGMKY